MDTDVWRVELHCHSCYSKDSNLSLAKLVIACQRANVDVVAVTDHNEIAGAQMLAAKAPASLRVIVGEEIATAEGDLIGLFLQERIEPRLPIAETIRRIRGQGGVVIAPHPFDRLRHEAMGGAVLERIRNEVDFVETFNARCVFAHDNQRAAEFVTAHNLKACVASDAHWMSEHGNAICLMKPFSDAAEFSHNLAMAQFEMKRANMLVHAGTAVVKRAKEVGPEAGNMRIVLDARMYGPRRWTGIGRYLQHLVAELERLDKENDYIVLLGRGKIGMNISQGDPIFARTGTGSPLLFD